MVVAALALVGVLALVGAGARGDSSEAMIEQLSARPSWSASCFDMKYSGVAVSDRRVLTVQRGAGTPDSYLATIVINETLYMNGGCNPAFAMVTNTFRLGIAKQVASPTATTPGALDIDLVPLQVVVHFESDLAASFFYTLCPGIDGFVPDEVTSLDITTSGCGAIFAGTTQCPTRYTSWALNDKLELADVFVPFNPGAACNQDNRAADLDDQPMYSPAPLATTATKVTQPSAESQPGNPSSGSGGGQAVASGTGHDATATSSASPVRTQSVTAGVAVTLLGVIAISL
ncbi:Uncharacterized protein PBTT_02602 [Plasmodiophora brassicae]|uniref:Uncharacterized protein n=1 Tax=Plasmodiophora brassicae TaxID=37360 RepID=A0A3P3Y566_PLABS|nr:unnamed protein product [Plasmodiophora brassicae]